METEGKLTSNIWELLPQIIINIFLIKPKRATYSLYFSIHTSRDETPHVFRYLEEVYTSNSKQLSHVVI